MKRHIEHMKYWTVLAACAAILFSCDVSGIKETPEKQTGTVTVTITPEIYTGISESGIPAKSADGNPIGTREIWIFVWDNSSGAPVDGYPARQTGIIGTSYSFTIPKLTDARLFFAIMPEEVQYEFYNAEIRFSLDDIYAEDNEVWCSDGMNLNTDSGSETIPLSGITLEQRHQNYTLMFKCENFPSAPEEFVKDMSFRIDGVTYPQVINFSSLETETDEEGTVWRTYELTVLRNYVNSTWLEINFSTAKKDIFYFYTDVRGDEKDFRYKYTIDYERINGYYY